MDHSEISRLGGRQRVANMTAGQLATAAKKASRASWKGHKKTDSACGCKRCIKKRGRIIK